MTRPTRYLLSGRRGLTRYLVRPEHHLAFVRDNEAYDVTAAVTNQKTAILIVPVSSQSQQTASTRYLVASVPVTGSVDRTFNQTAIILCYSAHTKSRKTINLVSVRLGLITDFMAHS